jgi:hypothetical protein
MSTCETCQHWDGPSDDGGWRKPKGPPPYFWGACKKIHHAFWQSDYLRDEDDEIIRGEDGMIERGMLPTDVPNAVTMDGSDYRSGLDTNRLFGCVLWEEYQ